MTAATNRFDGKRIDIADPADVERWAGRLGLSVTQLRAVVLEVGTWVAAIELRLKPGFAPR